MRAAPALFCIVLLSSCAPSPGVPPLAPAHAADARKTNGDLLYVSDVATGYVYVYSYPRGRLMLVLGRLNHPQGLCSDTRGDVYVAEAGDGDIVEYAHGSRKRLKTLSDADYAPQGCSVDPTTGDLAVTDSDPQSVAVYRNARGKPTHYLESTLTSYYGLSQAYFCGYDDKGNLFVDGTDYSSSPAFEFAELPKGGKALVSVTLGQHIDWPGNVQWDGRYLAVGDEGTGTIYQFTIRNRQGTLEGTTPLDEADGVYQFWIDGSRVIGPNSYGVNVMIWDYPRGGSPVQVVANPRPQPHQPYGTTVSAAP